MAHHNPCFNLFTLHNNSFDNQGSEINENDIFFSRFDILSFTKILSTENTLLLKILSYTKICFDMPFFIMYIYIYICLLFIYIYIYIYIYIGE